MLAGFFIAEEGPKAGSKSFELTTPVRPLLMASAPRILDGASPDKIASCR